MARSRQKSNTIISIIGFVLLTVAIIGVVTYFTKKFSEETTMFYIKVNGDYIISEADDYYVSRETPLVVEMNYALDFDKQREVEDYIVDIKANDRISFSYKIGEKQYAFGNNVDWNSLFTIEKRNNGFALIPKADSLNALISLYYDVPSVSFSIPEAVPNLFYVTISSWDNSVQYKIYFSLSQTITGVTLNTTEIVV